MATKSLRVMPETHSMLQRIAEARGLTLIALTDELARQAGDTWVEVTVEGFLGGAPSHLADVVAGKTIAIRNDRGVVALLGPPRGGGA